MLNGDTDATIWLLTDRSSQLTGVALPVDGARET